MRPRRHEVASAGFDDYLARLGGHATGLRVPAPPPSAGIVAPYTFLLASVELLPDDFIVGISQLATLGAKTPFGDAGPPFYPFERPIGLGIMPSLWHPPDGFIVWTLTLEPTPPSRAIVGPLDQESFIFEDAMGPALLYETAHFPVAPTAPGYLGLDGYTPPALRGRIEMVLRDIRFPWGQNSFHAMRRPVDGSTRARLYAQVTQTNPATRGTLPVSITGADAAAVSELLLPEDLYLAKFASSALYHRVAGRIVIERGRNEDVR